MLKLAWSRSQYPSTSRLTSHPWRHSRTYVLLLVLGLLAAVTLAVHAAPQEIILLHTNDIHGHLREFAVGDATMGGLHRLAGLVDAYRAVHPGRVLWLDGGDTWHGTNPVNFSQGASMVEVLSAAGLDAMVLGNHDFNYGIETLRRRVEEARFPVLAANVVTAEGELLVGATALLDAGGLKVGVLGLSTQDTPFTTHPGNVAGLRFDDPVEVAGRLVPQLAAEADLVVALTHLGYESDRELALAVPGIDVIVGGHSHTLLAQPVKVGETLIVQAHEWGKYLGVLRLTVDGGEVIAYEGGLVPITPEIPGNERLAQLIAGWEDRLSEFLDEVVGETAVRLDGEREQVRRMETNLGNLVADVVRETASADIALVNGGGIRRSVPPGPITLGTVYEVLPFENTVVGLLLTGEQVLAALENGVSQYPETQGRFPQVSGLSFAFDPSAPPGQRVKEVWVRQSAADPSGSAGSPGDLVPLDPNATYRVAVIDFMAAGGDEYTMMVDAPRYYGSTAQGGTYLAELLAAYLSAESPVAPEVEGRIRIVDDCGESINCD